MKRLLTSSKFMGPALLAIAAGLGILLGFSDEQAAKLFETLVWVVGLFGVGYQGSTAFEDGRKAAASGDSAPPAAGSVTPLLMLMAVGTMVMSNLVGCAAVDPGGQTAKAFNQDFHFGYDKDGNLAVMGAGSQNGKFVMARGDNVVLNEDGTMSPAKSKLNNYLAYDPKSDDIRDAYGIALENSTRQIDRMSQTVDNLLGLIVLRSMNTGGSVSEPDIADLVRAQVRASLSRGVPGLLPPLPSEAPPQAAAAPAAPVPQPAPQPVPQPDPIPVPAAPPPATAEPPSTAPTPEPVPASAPATRDAAMG